MFLFHFARGNEIPLLGGKWSIPKHGEIDWKLVTGAAIFGVGWGFAGICRECLLSYRQNDFSGAETEFPAGPGLVNFGRSLVSDENSQISGIAIWLIALATGGLFV
jgi:hypothetical protein